MTAPNAPAPNAPRLVGADSARTPWGNRARVEQAAHVHEIRGGENPRILRYFVDGRCSYLAREDETPWCAAFVCAVLELEGWRSARSAAARDFATWGKALSAPITDAVIVLRHKSGADGSATGSSSGYHVGLYAGELRTRGRATHVRLLGGNQSDEVKYSDFPLANYEVVAVRWPTTKNAPAGA